MLELRTRILCKRNIAAPIIARRLSVPVPGRRHRKTNCRLRTTLAI